MKTATYLGSLLLFSLSLAAQPNPDNMFISGHVANSNGTVLPNTTVCLLISSPIIFPDTVCTTTDSSGYYYFDVAGGSISGANIMYEVSIADPCSNQVLSEWVQNAQGTIDTATVNFTVCANTPNCNVEITSTADTSGVYTLVASGTGIAPFSYVWSTGDTAQSITVANVAAGDVFCVTATDNAGCSATACDTVVTQGQNGCSAEVASFLVDPNNPYVYLVYANAQGTPPYTYLWSNGQTGQGAQYMFNQPGIYTPCVVVTDATGCVFTACDTLVVDSVTTGCVASMNYVSANNPNGLITEGDTVNFYFSGTAGDNLYQWTVSGNGLSLSSADENPVFGFPSSGLYEVCVFFVDSLTGCSDQFCDSIVVQAANPGNCQAGIWYPGSPSGVLIVEDTVQLWFDGVASNLSSYLWTISINGFMFTSTEMNPWFAVPPTLIPIGGVVAEVCVTVTDSVNNCSDTTCETVLAVQDTSASCMAAFTWAPDSILGGPLPAVWFTDQSTGAASWYWDFGDGYTSTDQHPLHAYNGSGTYLVCLTVVSADQSCQNTYCDSVIVGGNGQGNCFGYITGAVNAGTPNQPLDEGIVYLITFDSTTNILAAVDSFLLDSGNFYFFGPLDCGEYLVKAAASPSSAYYAGHVPTYYGNSLFWAFAQPINVGQANPQVTADVNLIAANNPGGPGFIGGDVTQGANKFEMDPGDPMAGMEVLLLNMSNHPIAYTYTDATGNFGFDNLAWGTYKVYVEALGVQTIPAVVTIGSDNPSVEDLNIYASETLISTGIAHEELDASVSEIYPNPANSLVHMQLDLKESERINISLLDLSGRQLRTKTSTVSSGGAKITLDVSDVKSGSYFIELRTLDGLNSIVRQFMKVD